MYKPKYLLLAVLASTLSLCVSAQKEEEDMPEPRKSYLDFSTYYLSNAVYFGRKDSGFIRYVHPAIGYHHKSGLSLEAGFSYQVGNTEPKKVDFYEIEGKYEFSLSKRLSAEVYASKFFFSKNVELEALPDLKAIAGAQVNYDADLVSINAGLDYYIANNNLFIATAGISHEFQTPKRKRGQWSFEPSACVYAGTQYYYHLPSKFAIDTAAPWEPLEAKKMSVLAYEFSVPVTYQTNHLELYFKPTYAIPVSPVNAEADYDLEVLKREHLTNSFFIEAGIHIKIW